MSRDNNLEFPDNLPMIPVRDLVVFPYMIIPLYIERESSIRAVEDALSKNRYIFLASQKNVSEIEPTPQSIYETGTVAVIIRMRKLSDGRIKILVQGVAKAEVELYSHTQPFFSVAINKLDVACEDFKSNPEKYQAAQEVVESIKSNLQKIISTGRSLSPDILLILDDISDMGRFSDLIASNLNLKVQDAQKVLETHDIFDRLKFIDKIVIQELEMIQNKEQEKAELKETISQAQKESFFKEQIRSIQNEVGGESSGNEELDEIKERIKSANMSEDACKEAMKQLGRLGKMHSESSEASVVRTYLDWLCDLPWSVASEDCLDINHAKEILDQDHYELNKVKERILEFLAVRKLKNNEVSGPILCFAGPPGVGKTSLGKSIARAMGREYHRIALGGVKDVSDIRGHRRTYVGSMPGRIIQAIKACKTNNPVIVLDEIDKLASDMRGDPSSAMLEVLDSEQNSSFRDNYLNVDFDLSNVFFLATANVLENIPPALRDRMEVISVTGYSQNDKVAIAKKHLVDKQIKEHGIGEDSVSFTEEGLKTLISQYTREAGLRNLNREIGSICRKIAKYIVLGGKEKWSITAEKVIELLGAPRFLDDEALKENCIGITTGLAWTPSGGQILHVETAKMKGKGGLVLTGQLGDVMKESARAALSYAKANHQSLGIKENWFDQHEIHVHFPAGAIPKDGPSAGITISTSLISLMTNRPVRSDVAMTGEVTLTGRVLPVGGIREKSLAALNQNVPNIILPMANKKDIDELPKELQARLNFILVENLDEVLQIALEPEQASNDSKKVATSKHDEKESAA